MWTEEKLDLLKEKIKSSLEFDEESPNGEARLMALGHKLLQHTVLDNCFETIHNKGSKCRVNKKTVPKILSDDINNLTEKDVMTLLNV